MINIEHLQFLTRSGFKILKLYEDELNTSITLRHSYWISYEFNPAENLREFGTTFHTVQGLEITDFMATNTLQMNENAFLAKVTKFIEESEKMTCKFHHAIKWKLYSS